jgi:hypothetical protein
VSEPKGKRRRGPGRPFPPGVSGNPKGRPKTNQEFVDIAREGEEALLQKLYLIGLQRSDSTAVRAIELRLAYARGRPKVIAELTGPDGGPLRINYDDVRTKLTDLAKKAEERRAQEVEAAAAESDAADDDDHTDGD